MGTYCRRCLNIKAFSVKVEAKAPGMIIINFSEQKRLFFFQNDLRELEEMCTEMGDRMQDHIDEQQEQIDQVR